MADDAWTRISLLSVKDVILMLVERPNGSSFGFNGSVSFALESFRRITTVASFGFSRITAGQPGPATSLTFAPKLGLAFGLPFVAELTLVVELALALAFTNNGTWLAYWGEENDWLVPGRLFAGEKIAVAEGGWTPRWREQLRQ